VEAATHPRPARQDGPRFTPAPPPVPRDTAAPGRHWPLAYLLPPLGALPTAPRTARAHVRDVLSQWQLGHYQYNAVLIASELVTNVVRQATAEDGTPRYINGSLPLVQLSLYSDRQSLLIAVYDQVPGTPTQAPAGPRAETGRGLAVIASLGHWDWHPAPGGKIVRAYLAPAA
jgi:anti-sigma regulatory factor (Ser/Thr protein kinase)